MSAEDFTELMRQRFMMIAAALAGKAPNDHVTLGALITLASGLAQTQLGLSCEDFLKLCAAVAPTAVATLEGSKPGRVN
jgi:hypothetical protein